MEDEKITPEDIKKILPYTEPFLFVDEVESISENRIVAIKHLRKDEWFFKGHFKDFPIAPGTILLEAVGQTGSLFIRKKLDSKNIDVLAFKIKKAEFLKPSFPGESIQMNVEMQDVTPFFWSPKKPRIWQAKGKITCKGELRGSGVFQLAVLDKKRFRRKVK